MPDVLRRVGRYDLLDVIGRGGAAVVYLAHQRDLRRHVALKELSPFQAGDETFAGRFVEESRLAGSMSHANIVTVHEYFEDASVPYIAMEYLPHGSLRQYIGGLSTAQVAGVLEGVLAGLSHGESRRIVHRDLKPENLLVAADGRVKIADFGVARAYNKAVTRQVVTVAGTTIGTPAYMAPEQALGADLTPATDLYSLGVVAWELLSGKVPFEETDTPMAVLYRHVHEAVPSVRSVAPDVDERLAEWLERMLEKRPEDRFQSADDAWIALEDVVIELAGPRWRREARLVSDEQAAAVERPLTPATFEGVAAEDPPAAPAPIPAPAVPATLDPAPAVPADGPATVAPRRPRQRSNTTMMRIARRHRDPAPGHAAASSGPGRRRMTIIVIALVLAATGAAGGVLAARTGSSHHRSGPSPAAERAAKARAAAETQLVSIIRAFATTRNTETTDLVAATTPAAQATAAAALQRSYATAAAKVRKLDGTAPAVASLHAALAKTAADYRELATAARTSNGALWNAARRSIKADERTLHQQVAHL